MFFQTSLEHFVPMLVKSVSSMCSAKTCTSHVWNRKRCHQWSFLYKLWIGKFPFD